MPVSDNVLYNYKIKVCLLKWVQVISLHRKPDTTLSALLHCTIEPGKNLVLLSISVQEDRDSNFSVNEGIALAELVLYIEDAQADKELYQYLS